MGFLLSRSGAQSPACEGLYQLPSWEIWGVIASPGSEIT